MMILSVQLVFLASLATATDIANEFIPAEQFEALETSYMGFLDTGAKLVPRVGILLKEKVRLQSEATKLGGQVQVQRVRNGLRNFEYAFFESDHSKVKLTAILGNVSKEDRSLLSSVEVPSSHPRPRPPPLHSTADGVIACCCTAGA